MINLQAASKRRHEIRALEEAYGKDFLRRSMHEAGIRWRELTAPNAAERFDGVFVLGDDGMGDAV